MLALWNSRGIGLQESVNLFTSENLRCVARRLGSALNSLFFTEAISFISVDSVNALTTVPRVFPLIACLSRSAITPERPSTFHNES